MVKSVGVCILKVCEVGTDGVPKNVMRYNVCNNWVRGDGDGCKVVDTEVFINVMPSIADERSISFFAATKGGPLLYTRVINFPFETVPAS